MSKLGYVKMKKDRKQKKQERLEAWKRMGTLGKLFTIAGVIASPLILCFLLLIVIYIADTSVPYNFKLVEKLENPSEFTDNIYYSEIDNIYEYEFPEDKREVQLRAMRLHENTGLQTYIVGMYVDKEMKSENEFIEKCEKYINENIKDDYGVYLLFSDYIDDNPDIEYFIYTAGDSYILGKEAKKFFNSGVLETYVKAEEKVKYHTTGYYGALEEFFMIMDYVIDRNMHPVKSILTTLMRLLIATGIVIVVVILVKKQQEKKRIQAVLESNLDELVSEHEDLYSKYKE